MIKTDATFEVMRIDAWIDPGSAGVLVFGARRPYAGSAAMMFAARETPGPHNAKHG